MKIIEASDPSFVKSSIRTRTQLKGKNIVKSKPPQRLKTPTSPTVTTILEIVSKEEFDAFKDYVKDVVDSVGSTIEQIPKLQDYVMDLLWDSSKLKDEMLLLSKKNSTEG